MHSVVHRGITWVWQERVRMARYFVIGVSAVVLDLALYWFFTRLLHVEYRVANLMSTLLGAVYVFVGNKFWSFGEHANTRRQSRRFIILFVWNYFFQQAAFFVLVHFLHVYDLVAKIGIIILLTTWNFLLYRYWVYATVN